MARRLGAISREAGAREFSLFFIANRSEKRRLVPLVDSLYPGISDTTRMLSVRFGDRFIKRMASSTIPCRWAGRDVAEAAAALEALYWTDSITAPEPASSGLALPLLAEAGQAGVVIFSQMRAAPDMTALADIHGRCLALFSVLARLRPAPGANLPPISRRELECLQLTAEGLTSEQIADRLGLSIHTANQYLASTGRKLNAVNRMQAVAKALRAGLID